MGANILAYIQFDDNTPRTDAPFTCDPSCWNLAWDLGLYGCKDYDFIGAISGIRNNKSKPPLIPLRGCPPKMPKEFKDFEDASCAGYLTLSEIQGCLNHHEVSQDSSHRSIKIIMAVLGVLVKEYGDDRVRLVFVIRD